MTRSAGLIWGPRIHYLDHLGPLCSLRGIPLIVTHEAIAAQAHAYYPDLHVICLDPLTAAESIVSAFEVIFCCTPRATFQETFFFAQGLLGKQLQTVWCPHGNSDKGASLFYMEALRDETHALIYGQQMQDFLKEKGAWDQLQESNFTGNFRYEFFKKHRAFYDQILEREILAHLAPAKTTLLYAPTWKDCEDSCSFFDAIRFLVEGLRPDTNLIVKLHPNLPLQEPHQVDHLIDRFSSMRSVLFLKEFPPVYPLLSLVDAYIGDMSSIGYDFLTFDKPLFLLNQKGRDSALDRGLYLFRCGVEITPRDYPRLHDIIEEHLASPSADLKTLRQQVYSYAFAAHSLKTDGRKSPPAENCEKNAGGARRGTPKAS
jgi:hypothetical protein